MKRLIFLFVVAILPIWNHEASAFWGSGAEQSASGLDVAGGFDVNTITTLTGRVITPPERKGTEQHTEMSVATTQGGVTVVLGPWWYWEKQTISITKNQELVITGSLALGKDGERYVFAQRLENRSNGETVTFRSESGIPLWSRGGSGSQRQSYGSGSRSGAGNRGSGMRGGRR